MTINDQTERCQSVAKKMREERNRQRNET